MTQGVLVQLKVSTQILPGLILDIQDPNDQMGVSENVVPPNRKILSQVPSGRILLGTAFPGEADLFL